MELRVEGRAGPLDEGVPGLRISDGCWRSGGLRKG